MEKLQSKDIEWQEGDVCALIDTKTNELVLKYTFKKFDSGNGRLNYIVTREDEPVKTVFDAVNYYKAVNPLSETCCVIYKDDLFTVEDTGHWLQYSVCTFEEFNQCVTDLTGDPLYHYAWLTALNDMRRQKEQQTTEEVLHGLFDKSRSPWVNLANLCGKMAKEHPAEVFAEGEPQKATEKPTYTQAMKDAGELPCVGMECVVEYAGGNMFDSTITYISKNGFAHVNKCDGKEFFVGTVNKSVVTFKPIDTRTPEQKQIEEAAHFIDINHGASSSFIAKEMQKSGLLAEIKSLFVVGGS